LDLPHVWRQKRATAGDEKARMPKVFLSIRSKKTIGAYTTMMDGIDALVFAAGIGENSSVIRREICDSLVDNPMQNSRIDVIIRHV